MIIPINKLQITNMKIIAITLFICLIVLAFAQCTHPIFCSPTILQAIAKSNLFPDSKTFVDLVLTVPVQTALDNFRTKSVSDFVNSSFHPDPNIVLETAQFADFQQRPSSLSKITNPELKSFAQQLNYRWNLLGKKIVLENAQKIGSCKQQCTSLLPELDGKTMLVPGGRFRQSYYWDTYWIVLGLIASEMFQTAESLLDNFAIVIDKYGFIPNGMRQYYLNRSQPPFFFLMLKQLTEALSQRGQTEKVRAIEKKYFQILLKEQKYWETTHSVTVNIEGKSYVVSQYRANTETARPQSYRQDINTVANIQSTDEKRRVLGCLSSMAESGWDFSSRWLLNPADLTSTIIDELIPSDLNAIIGLQFTYLINLSSKFGRQDLFYQFFGKYQQRVTYFNAIKKTNRFPDHRINDRSWTAESVYPSDYLPFLLLSQTVKMPSIYDDLVNPSSSGINTGQQWDKPNVWAPNNWILHEVLAPLDAKQLADQWVTTTYCGWKKTGNLYEKYRNDAIGERGQGGQYTVQTGFGWTNGLALHYLNLYGDSIHLGGC